MSWTDINPKKDGNIRFIQYTKELEKLRKELEQKLLEELKLEIFPLFKNELKEALDAYNNIPGIKAAIEQSIIAYASVSLLTKLIENPSKDEQKKLNKSINVAKSLIMNTITDKFSSGYAANCLEIINDKVENFITPERLEEYEKLYSNHNGVVKISDTTYCMQA